MFLIQGGYQSSTHIAEALPAERAGGVIWSPGDESPDSLRSRMDEAATSHGVVQAIDPQLYVALLADGNPKRLPTHELFDVPLPRNHFSARRIAALVERIIRYQAGLPSTHLIAPTVAVASPSARSAQVALNLAETSLDIWADDYAHDPRSLLVSAAIQRPLLHEQKSVNVLLDELTAHEADGYYLLFEIDPGLEVSAQASILAEALYIVYTLAVTQERAVWVGYAGLAGYLYRAVGAEAFAAGWFQKQQWWSLDHWGPPTGGRTPRPRIFLDAILGSLLAEPELKLARTQPHDPALGDHLLAGAGALAEAYREGDVPVIDRPACAAQLFEVCAELDGRITGDVATDLARARGDLDAATGLHDRLEAAGVELDGRSTGRQVDAWRQAIDLFAERGEVDL